MANDNEIQQAGVRGTIIELEKQRNNAFTRAAQIAGELEQVKVAYGALNEELSAAKDRVTELEAKADDQPETPAPAPRKTRLKK